MIVVSSVIGVSLLWRFWQASNTRHDTPPSQIPSPRFMHSCPANKPKRKPIPAHIPRVEVELTPGNTACAQCGGKLRRLGEV